MKQHILVTGGTGYIGSHTAVELIEEGFSVTIIDDLSNSEIEVLDGIEAITGVRPEFEKMNVCDQEKLFSMLHKKPDFDAIIHFAAHKSVPESVQQPLKYYRNNLTSLMNLLAGMEKHRIPCIVFSSSCTVYGQPDVLPVTEKSPIQPAASPYGNTKRIAEEIISDSAVASSFIKGISLRYFNPIGAHQSALIGELPLGVPDNLVPYITQTGIGIRPALRVFGNDYNTPDGTAIRDYLHVVDLARAHVMAIDRLLNDRQKKRYEVFNLGIGKGVSVLEMIQSFERVSGRKLNHEIHARRPGDIEKIWADTSYANTELGWRAERSIDDAVLSAWNWEQYYRKHISGRS
jgi:UDP-glucose 4-epimerase